MQACPNYDMVVENRPAASPLALRKGCAFPWSFYICDEVNDEGMRTSEGTSLSPRPLGGEGGPQPALSPAGAGRVRGSNP